MFKWSASITMVGLALGGLLLTGTPAGAQAVYGGNGGNIDQREGYQQQRIQQGIDSGALTPGETRYLEREQARIQAAEQRMKADGNLSPWERQRLRQMQNQANRDIYRLEHNNRTTAGWSGHTNSAWRGNNHSGWGGRGEGWHGNNPVGAGNTPNGVGHRHGWQGNGNSGWRGNNPVASGHTPGGTTPAGNTQGWRGNHTGGSGTTASGNTTPGNTQNTQGWQGNHTGGSGTTASGITTAGNTRGQQGNYYRNGQSGAFQQPGTRPQSQRQYQQARSQMPQPTIRPNASMMPRQPTGLGSMANRASFSAPRAAPRRR